MNRAPINSNHASSARTNTSCASPERSLSSVLAQYDTLKDLQNFLFTQQHTTVTFRPEDFIKLIERGATLRIETRNNYNTSFEATCFFAHVLQELKAHHYDALIPPTLRILTLYQKGLDSLKSEGTSSWEVEIRTDFLQAIRDLSSSVLFPGLIETFAECAAYWQIMTNRARNLPAAKELFASDHLEASVSKHFALGDTILNFLSGIPIWFSFAGNFYTEYFYQKRSAVLARYEASSIHQVHAHQT